MVASRTKEELDALANLDPEIDAVMKSGRFPFPKIDLTSGYEEPLARLRGLAAQFPTPGPIEGVVESNPKYTARDGTELNLFVFDCPATKGPKPVIIYFHGGGGVMGDAYSVAPLARDLVQAHSCVVVSPQYRLAPEHAFPTGTDDAWDAFCAVTTDPSRLNADASPQTGLIVGGASHGAVLTSLIALRAKDNPQTKITGLYFGAGGFIASPDSVPAEYREQYLSRTSPKCLAAPILDGQTKAMFDAAYNADRTSPKYRALNHQPLSLHAGVAPKALFQVCGADILRDDSLIYGQILEGLGVDVKVDVYEGAPHVFWSIFAFTKLAQRWREENRQAVGWLLGRETTKL